MEKTINVIELACELAHSRTFDESGDIINNEDDMFETHEDGTQYYKEEIQDRFNHWYDYYLGEINKCSID
jgi:hypothetical protein